MDDLFNQLFNNEDPNVSSKKAATLKELERRSQDRIRVYNPTNEDFTVKWDSRGFVVPSKNKDNGNGQGQAVFPRYIAENYVKHMANRILELEMVEAIDMENKRRLQGGMGEMNHFQERVQFDGKFKIDNPDKRARLLPILWLGIEEKFGMEVVDDREQARRDPRSIDEQVLATLERPARRPEDVDVNLDLPSTPQEAPSIAVQPEEPALIDPAEGVAQQ